MANEILQARQDVDRYRQLVQVEGDEHLRALAGSLRTLAWQLGEAGELTEARTVALEAIDLCRRLDHLVGWVGVLEDLPRWLNGLGDDEAAIAAARERVEVARRLSTQDDYHLPKVAAALRTLGNRLADADQRWAALAATEEAVWLYRAIGYRPRNGYIFDVADTLIDLDRRRSDVDDFRGAAAAAQEAVDVYGRLAADTPERFERPLASALNDLGWDLSEIGETEAALEAFDKAVRIYRRVVDETGEYRNELALALRNLGCAIADVGRFDEARHLVQESVTIYRSLVAEDPGDHRSTLAGALDYLGKCLAEVAEHDAGLAATTESVALYRALLAEDSQYAPDLAEALDNLGQRLTAVGRADEALAAAEESVALHRVEPEPARPRPSRPEQGWALINLARRLAESGDANRAVGTAYEATEVWVELIRRQRRAHLHGHAEAQFVFADLLRSHDPDEAYQAAYESRAAYQELADRFPQRYAERLTDARTLVDALRE